MFCESPNFLAQTKYGIAFSAALKDFLPTQELNLLVWHKTFGPFTICQFIFTLTRLAQNLLVPVEGQGNNLQTCKWFL